MPEIATEELIVRQDDCVDPDVIAQRNNEELVLCGASVQHIGVLIFNQDGVCRFAL